MRSLIISAAIIALAGSASGTACEKGKAAWFQCATSTSLSPGEICVPLCAGETVADPCAPCDDLASACAAEWPNYLKAFGDASQAGKWQSALPPNTVLKGGCPAEEKVRTSLVSSVICVNSAPGNEGCRNAGNGNKGDWNIGDNNVGNGNVGNGNTGDNNRGSFNKANCARGNTNTQNNVAGNENVGASGVKCLAPGQLNDEDAALPAAKGTEKVVPATGGADSVVAGKVWAGAEGGAAAAPAAVAAAVAPAKPKAVGAPAGTAAATPAAELAAPVATPKAAAAVPAVEDKVAVAPAATPKATPKATPAAAAATPKPTAKATAPAATPAAASAAEPTVAPPMATPAPLKTSSDAVATPTKLAPLPEPKK